jgi:hypothetical protein
LFGVLGIVSKDAAGQSSGSGGIKSWNCPKYPVQEFNLNEKPVGEYPEEIYTVSPGFNFTVSAALTTPE